jgi:hypothetical protein
MIVLEVVVAERRTGYTDGAMPRRWEFARIMSVVYNLLLGRGLKEYTSRFRYSEEEDAANLHSPGTACTLCCLCRREA